MTHSPKSLGTHLQQLEAIERRLHDAARRVKTDHEGLSGLAARIASASEERRVTLARRCEQLGLEEVSGPELLSATRGLAALLADASVSAAALHAVAHRAFDSQAEGNTADLAEAQLGAHLRELDELLDTVSDLVVHESGSAGEECRCGCPACSLGLCLCPSHGTNTVREARGAAAAGGDGGLRVRRPRRGSAVEGAGVRAGERVTAIDGTAIAHDLDTSTVQGAIRARSAGDELRLRVVARDGSEREVGVRRT